MLLDQHLEFVVQLLKVFAQIAQPTVQQVERGAIRVRKFVLTIFSDSNLG